MVLLLCLLLTAHCVLLTTALVRRAGRPCGLPRILRHGKVPSSSSTSTSSSTVVLVVLVDAQSRVLRHGKVGRVEHMRLGGSRPVLCHLRLQVSVGYLLLLTVLTRA